MKKLINLLFVALVFTLSSCGPNAQEEAEKARQDSIMEQQRLDSIAVVEALEAEMLRIQDSIQQVAIIDSVKAAEKYKYNAKPKKVEKKVQSSDTRGKKKTSTFQSKIKAEKKVQETDTKAKKR